MAIHTSQRARLQPMPASTRQLIEVLAALSPYLLFIALIIWSAVAELREETRAARPPRAERDT